ncbi:hypothetical protein BC833DRAFT_616862 [Globomyces pollinis-pini]|nr:hypothetical protein BC833DRAFT_616862 [Globomyces pollinis-pini]
MPKQKVIPTVPNVLGRRKYISISKEYIVPTKRIITSNCLEKFSTSEAYFRILDFCQSLNEAVKNKPNSSDCVVSKAVLNTIHLLDVLDSWIDEFPPETTEQRYGNVSFRKWHAKLQSNLIEQQSTLIPNHLAIHEISAYLLVSFGDPTRIDYGSGHELSFTAWLCCLELVDYFNAEDYQALVTKVFKRYIDLVWKLQKVYQLEPAGSHGVWGLDDYQFLPYFWGSAQLLDHPKIKPKSITDKEMVAYFALEYLYLGCINHINETKRGPFHEHSPILFDISAVPFWSKVNTGMMKMYIAEVLMKFPVSQHFLFGSLLPFEESKEILTREES